MTGLKTSIWASSGKNSHDNSIQYRRPDRARSVPPQSSSTRRAAVSSAVSAGVSSPAAAAAAAAASTTRTSLTAAQALHRFEQVCQRLRWKFVDLESAYTRAVSPHQYDFTAEDAERNFKVDFHEFYVWIEQAVVLLLQVVGVEIREPPGAKHMYHHNVLMAAEEGVYGTVLGVGDVKAALWKAKELRNRWKDAAEGKETPPLGMYDLGWIVRSVLRGLEAAYEIAKEEVSLQSGQADQVEIMEEEGWDWMVESMDWEP